MAWSRVKSVQVLAAPDVGPGEAAEAVDSVCQGWTDIFKCHRPNGSSVGRESRGRGIWRTLHGHA